MSPTDNIVRFIVIYSQDLKLPQYLILGKGFGGIGLNFQELLECYLCQIKTSVNIEWNVYCGSLFINNPLSGVVSIFQGGSLSLNVGDDPDKTQKFLQEVEGIQNLKESIALIYRRIVSGEIPHKLIIL